ncbi:transposase [Nonomuraea sp. NPDC050663]|uniref:transposase n=1 Tax=Nonomuraea sp. NPDC050663 TaxID=3364370 RepID=UPI0037B7DA75
MDDLAALDVPAKAERDRPDRHTGRVEGRLGQFSHTDHGRLRDQLTNAAWVRIESLLPARRAQGRRWLHRRSFLNGILWKATSAPWQICPTGYGKWKSLPERYRRWAAGGTFDALLQHVQVHDDAFDRPNWKVSVGSATVRASARPARPGGTNQAPGRSRDGLTKLAPVRRRTGPAPRGAHHSQQHQRLYRLARGMKRIAVARTGAERPRPA